MFETDSFKSQIDETIRQEAGRRGMARFQLAIVDYLQDLAKENERELMEHELRKTTGRRGTQDALRSVAVLVEYASLYATAENRTLLKMEDMRKAYQAKYCSVWPFCK